MIVIEGEKNIHNAKLLITRSALHLKIHKGIGVSRNYNVTSVVKKIYNFKGNNEKIWQQFNELVTRETGIKFAPQCDKCK